MSQRKVWTAKGKVSTAKELRVFLVHLLCILTLVQGPPLEAAEQKVRERTLWVEVAESAERGESLTDRAAVVWQEVKEELAEGTTQETQAAAALRRASLQILGRDP